MQFPNIQFFPRMCKFVHFLLMLYLSDEPLYSSVYTSLIYYKTISQCTSFFTCVSQVWDPLAKWHLPQLQIFSSSTRGGISWLTVNGPFQIFCLLSLLWARGKYVLTPLQKTGTLGDSFVNQNFFCMSSQQKVIGPPNHVVICGHSVYGVWSVRNVVMMALKIWSWK